ncbi:hypothetical protein Syun_016661 [Stephania yunnanensis]|uniref:Uncharacterized protein n=1 Tax=Stephania yunnanensis TaxID=152371 RepID=A0AAP0J5N2_9MAGN
MICFSSKWRKPINDTVLSSAKTICTVSDTEESKKRRSKDYKLGMQFGTVPKHE